MQNLAIVIPCYNESKRLDRRELLTQLDEQPGLKLFLVNDGSKDDTGRLLDELVKERPDRIQTISLKKNRGKGEAVRRGVLLAMDQGFPFVGYWDADLATPLGEIQAFMAIFERHPEVQIVLGSRVKLLGHEIQRRKIRHYAGRVFATAASIALALPVYDTQCGAKIFRVCLNSEALTSRIGQESGKAGMRMLFDKPFRSRWIFDVEILARFIRFLSGSSRHSEVFLYELPLKCWRDVRGSKVSAKDLFVGLYELFLIWRRYRPTR